SLRGFARSSPEHWPCAIPSSGFFSSGGFGRPLIACHDSLLLYRGWRMSLLRLLCLTQTLFKNFHEIDHVGGTWDLRRGCCRRNAGDLHLDDFHYLIVVVILVLLWIELVGHRIDERVRQVHFF